MTDQKKLLLIPNQKTTKKSYKHAERSCNELPYRSAHCRFFRWAFGSNELPNLQIIAFGDFSYEGRFAKGNMLLCRDRSFLKGYRDMDDQDTECWELLDLHKDMISACPFESL